jgi:hypothetical protein
MLWLSVVAAAAAGCRFDPSGVALGGGDDAPDGGGNGGPADAALPVADAPPAPIDATPAPDAAVLPKGYRRAITIHAGAVGGKLEDFPVYVALTDASLAAHAAADGSDIYFTADDGTAVLDHEIQRWDAGGGVLQAWVRLPALDDVKDTTIYLHYGDATAAVAPNPAGVWKNGFVMVWHLEQAPSNQADVIRDSLGVRHGTTGGLSAGDLVASALGRGLRFSGGNDEVTFSNPLLGSTPHTISAWVDQGATVDNDALIVLGTGSCRQARWFHTRFGVGNAENVAAGFYCDDWLDPGFSVVGQGWTLVHWTFGGNDESRLYRDGALAAGPFQHDNPPATQGGSGRLGNASAAFGQNMGLHGVVDEVRISTIERDPAWIATEFANQSDPAGFTTVGPEEPLF